MKKCVFTPDVEPWNEITNTNGTMRLLTIVNMVNSDRVPGFHTPAIPMLSQAPCAWGTPIWFYKVIEVLRKKFLREGNRRFLFPDLVAFPGRD